MSKGRTSPPESSFHRDARTGAAIRQVTDHPSINHGLYFYVSSWPDDMRRLYFVSHRTGSPNLFADEDGRIVQLTDRDDLNGWSCQPSRDGRYVYFAAGCRVCRIDAETLREDEVAAFGELTGRLRGLSCSLSADGAWLAVTLRGHDRDRIAVVSTASGRTRVILERDEVWHTQFCPDDPELLQYSGPPAQRIWTIRRDGGADRQLYAQEPMEWVTHESWLGGTREVLFARWPRALMAVSADTGAVRTIAEFNAWHPSADRAGRRIVCDTNHPDVGLQLVDARSGERRTLSHPDASSTGEHWKGPFPYSVKPYPARGDTKQWTHPHPSFSPDGRRVVYTSDRTGCSQVYVVDVTRNEEEH